VSTICRELRDRYRAFRASSLGEVRLLVLMLDAIYLPVRPAGPKEGVLVAWGPAEAEHGLRVLVGELSREFPSAAACVASAADRSAAIAFGSPATAPSVSLTLFGTISHSRRRSLTTGHGVVARTAEDAEVVRERVDNDAAAIDELVTRVVRLAGEGGQALWVIEADGGDGAVLIGELLARGELVATLTQTTFCRGDGGFGGPPREAPPPYSIPERAPDLTCDLPTRPEMALIYRLSGDVNPLHADPEFAKAAGFPKPILHGLATFGVVGHAILKSLCGYDPPRLTAMKGRFSAPVYPGETIRTQMWRENTKGGSVISFRASVVERDVVSINNGRAEVR